MTKAYLHGFIQACRKVDCWNPYNQDIEPIAHEHWEDGYWDGQNPDLQPLKELAFPGKELV